MHQKLIISRRACLGLIASSSVFAQDGPQSGSSATSKPIEVLVVVSDQYDRFVSGLRTPDFRVFEDDLPQTILKFVEGRMPSTPAGNESATGTLADPKAALDRKAHWDEVLENSYTITYQPDPSNSNRGFRKIRIEIVADVKGRWRVRHRPGYRP